MMNKLLYTLGLAGMIAATPAFAQDNHSGKLGEYDEIILKRKDGKDGKVTIEIKAGEVYVDGKKLEDYKGGDISVLHRRNTPVDGNTFNFRSAPRGGMQLYRGEGDPVAPKAPSAVLGVITAKEDARGATVKQVSEGSPAAKAGLKEGDIITKINDEAIQEPQELFESIGTKNPGDEITVTYIRDKKESKVKTKLDKRPESQVRSFNFGQDEDAFNFRSVPRGGDLDELFGRMERRGGGNEARLGLSVQDTEEATGAKVLGVAEGSAAEKAGFKENDIITEIAGSAVRNARDVVSTYNMNKTKSEVSAKILRGGKAQTLTVKVPKKLNKENL